MTLPPDDTAASVGSRYYLIDVLRAFAAFAVLFWHFQIFSHYDAAMLGVLPDRTGLPLLALASPFYHHGHWAVQLFWMISGFVFYATYVPRGSQTHARSFFVHRFARLYPLHFLTLILVAVLQIISMHKLGVFQVYQYNDLKHFILQLFMASHWGFQKGFSFNGPIWSVSVEILIYAVFFGVIAFASRDRRVLTPVTIGLIIIGFLTRRHAIGQCLFYFFCGGGAWLLHSRMQRDWQAQQWPILAMLTAAALLAHIFLQEFQPNWQSHLSFALAFAAIISILAAAEPMLAASNLRALQPIGDLTYGVYLWHMPVVIAGLIVMDSLGIARTITNHLWFLMAFLAIVIVIARAGFVYFEKPANAAIKRRFLG